MFEFNVDNTRNLEVKEVLVEASDMRFEEVVCVGIATGEDGVKRVYLKTSGLMNVPEMVGLLEMMKTHVMEG